MPFPVTLNGITFSESDFAPTGYASALPDSVEALADQLIRPTYAASASSASITGATISINVGAAKGFRVGMSVLLVNDAALTTYALGTVLSYDAGTGALVVTRTGGAGSGTVTSWWVTQTPVVTDVLPIGAVQGGAGIATKFRNGIISKFSPEYGMQEVLEYFGTCATPIVDTFNVNSGSKEIPGWIIEHTPFPAEIVARTPAVSSVGHPEGLELYMPPPAVYETNKRKQFSIRHGYKSYCPAGSGALAFICRFTVGTSTNVVHTCRVGARGYSSAPLGDIFSSFGIGFEVSCVQTDPYASPPTVQSHAVYAVLSLPKYKQRVLLTPVADSTEWIFAFEMRNGQVKFSAYPVLTPSSIYSVTLEFTEVAIMTFRYLVQPAASFEVQRYAGVTTPQTFRLGVINMIKPMVRN